MEANIWFYTFSSAAQVVAALAGLFAVFVVYRIQEFGRHVREARFTLAKIIPYVSANTPGYKSVTAEAFHKMTDEEIRMTFAELLVVRENASPIISISVGDLSFGLDAATYDYFTNLIVKKEKLLKQLFTVLVVSLGTIAVALISLVLTEFLIEWDTYIWAALFLFLYCLWTIGNSIYQVTLE